MLLPVYLEEKEVKTVPVVFSAHFSNYITTSPVVDPDLL
jgi:hypothetical protein